MYLDVRPELERDAVGKAKGSINIPICNAKWVWNAEEGKKKMQKEDNELFIQQVGWKLHQPLLWSPAPSVSKASTFRC